MYLAQFGTQRIPKKGVVIANHSCQSKLTNEER